MPAEVERADRQGHGIGHLVADENNHPRRAARLLDARDHLGDVAARDELNERVVVETLDRAARPCLQLKAALVAHSAHHRPTLAEERTHFVAEHAEPYPRAARSASGRERNVSGIAALRAGTRAGQAECGTVRGMKTLEGKVVAITGAASGMGRELALECVRRGSDVAIVDVDEAGLAETAKLARSSRLGARVESEKLDVADRAALYAWAARVADRLGGADVVILNAGVSLSASVAKMTDEDLHWLFDINFWGVVNGCRAFLPQLQRKPEAHVVTVSSVFGLIGVPTQSAYCAAKFAVRGFTESLRQELAGTSVHVSCVHPGGIKTEIAKRGRHYEAASGEPTDTETAAASFAATARTTAPRAASIIVRGILRNDPRILVGPDAVAIDAMARLAPRGYDAVVRKALARAPRGRR